MNIRKIYEQFINETGIVVEFDIEKMLEHFFDYAENKDPLGFMSVWQSPKNLPPINEEYKGIWKHSVDILMDCGKGVVNCVGYFDAKEGRYFDYNGNMVNPIRYLLIPT